MQLTSKMIAPTKIFDQTAICCGTGYNLHKYIKINVRNLCVDTYILHHPIWEPFLFATFITIFNAIKKFKSA